MRLHDLQIELVLQFLCYIQLTYSISSDYCVLEKTSCNRLSHIGCLYDTIVSSIPLTDDNDVETLELYERDLILTKFNEIRNEFALGHIRESIQISNMKMTIWNEEFELLSKYLIRKNSDFDKKLCLITNNRKNVTKFRSIIDHPSNLKSFIGASIELMLEKDLKQIDDSHSFDKVEGVVISNIFEIGCSVGVSKISFEMILLCLGSSKSEMEDFYIRDMPCTNCYGECNEVPFAGICGLSGQRGDAGQEGDEGEKGSSGVGESGLIGDTGDQGENGTVNGDQGINGIPGDIGIEGEPAHDGVLGQKGKRGMKGESGQQGEAGEDGDQGEEGDPGEFINEFKFDFHSDWLFYIITGIIMVGILTNISLLILKLMSFRKAKSLLKQQPPMEKGYVNRALEVEPSFDRIKFDNKVKVKKVSLSIIQENENELVKDKEMIEPDLVTSFRPKIKDTKNQTELSKDNEAVELDTSIDSLYDL